jgi:hypothetical protein
MAVTISARTRFNGPSTPALIRGAGLSAALGIGLSITDYADLGKWISVGGVLLLIYSLHRFGRTGPDAPILFELAPPRKKKKKKRKTASEAEGPGSAPSETAEPTATETAGESRADSNANESSDGSGER